MKDLTESEALNRMTAYCASAEHCRAEVVDKMQRWGLSYEMIDRIVAYLEQEKYIDEERFCRAFIRDKYRFAKWGKVKIAQALQLKKISPLIYRLCFNEINEDEYFSILQNLLKTKKKSVHAANEYELNAKLMRFALSRGFEMKDIRRCITVSDENEYDD